MELKKSRNAALIGLGLIFLLAAFFRLYGLGWALNSGCGHYLNFQPDEFISVRGMLPVNLLAGKYRAPDAYFEGTFNYYLWSIPQSIHQLFGGRSLTQENISPAELRFLLISGRLMSVTFDLATLLLLYCVIHRLTRDRWAALFGAFLYGIWPMQVIYSHYMRTHLLSNFLCILITWLSLIALDRRRWWLFLLIGGVAGLATATRYPIGVILAIPGLLFLFQAPDKNAGRWPFLDSMLKLLAGPLWLILAGFFIGLFLGEPALFLEFTKVRDTVAHDTLSYVPAGASDPFNFKPVLTYFSTLIPYSGYPFLWIVIYLAGIYVIARRLLWRITIPLLLFVLLYAVPMAKGYIVIFARQVMLLLPVACILFGICIADLHQRFAGRRAIIAMGSAVICLLLLPSILFDWAYDRAMCGRDVRDLLRRDLSHFLNRRQQAEIAVSESGCYFYTVMPGVDPLKNKDRIVRLQKSFAESADLLAVGFERPLSEASTRENISMVEGAGAFKFRKVYEREPSLFGKTIDLSEFPPDMTYPFPTILLFRKVTN